MPTDNINGVGLYWELTGAAGDPLVLVHGSWGDHHNWDRVVPELSKTFRVLTYDRRGHSQSERPAGQGYMEEDVADLISLTEYVGLAPAHIAGNSGGAAIALKTASAQPDLFRTLVVHEPPLFGLLKDIPEATPFMQNVEARITAVTDLLKKEEYENAARQFVETIAMGPGAWQQLPSPVQQTFIYNAITFLDETQDPANLQIDSSRLSHFTKPTLMTNGTESPPFFLMVIEQLVKAIPHATRMPLEGAGHVPHMSNPAQYIDVIKAFCRTKS